MTRPNAYWALLGGKHAEMLDGFEMFKRTVNWHYGQFRVESYRDPRVVHLLRGFLARRTVPYVAFRARMHPLARAPLRRPRWYAFFVGLVWQCALQMDRLRCLDRCEEPLVGSPIPVHYCDRLITQDLASSAMEWNWISHHIRKDARRPGPTTVAEIGAGYGRLAYLVLKTNPDVRYSIFDIPPARQLATEYLTRTVGKCERWAVSSPEAFVGIEKEFDLIVNISSFDEMAPWQVEDYFRQIDRAGRGYLYVKQHHVPIPVPAEVSGPIVGCLQSMPWRAHWRLVAEAQDPVDPNFTQQLYWLGR